MTLRRLGFFIAMLALLGGLLLVPQVRAAVEPVGGGEFSVLQFEPPASVKQTQDAIINDTTNQSTSLDSFISGSADTTVDGKSASNGILANLFSGIVLQLGGQNEVRQVAQADGTYKTVVVRSPGAIGSATDFIAKIYEHPPVSSTEYIADLFDNIKHPFVPRAYAQGLGFSSLTPVLYLWKIFRNVAYLFFVVVFVITGFLIMIRSKIGSQASVTVQQMLPKLVVSLILVTFSYAIAGLMLDLMYLMIFLLIGIFGGTKELQQIALGNDIFTNGFQLITGGTAQKIAENLGGIVNNILVNLGWAQATAGVVSFGMGVIFLLVLLVAIVLSLFRVFFALLGAYVGIFFSVITAPIQLMFGALPGQNTFQKWIQGLLENIIVFPTIILLIFIIYFMTGKAGEVSKTASGFAAPQLGTVSGTTGSNFWSAIIALGAILAMPEVIKVAKGIMKGEAGIDIGTLGRTLKTGAEVGLPLYGAAAGGVVGGAGSVAGGIRGGTVTSIGGGLDAFLRGYRTEGGTRAKTGFLAGAQRGQKIGTSTARTIDNALEGKIVDPNAATNILERIAQREEQQRKARTEPTTTKVRQQ